MPDGLLKQIDAAKSVEDVAACIRAYYDLPDNSTGGALHIVLDDFNYGDDSVRYCVETAEATVIPGNGARPDWHQEPDPVGGALARKLLAMSVEDRAAANDPRRCRCGHAMSLHHWWSPDGTWGHSSSGACGSVPCSCVDAREVRDV